MLKLLIEGVFSLEQTVVSTLHQTFKVKIKTKNHFRQTAKHVVFGERTLHPRWADEGPQPGEEFDASSTPVLL